MVKTSSIAKLKLAGGPQTDEGKKIASRNSLKTGTYSKQIVLPNESQEEFDQLVEQFQRDFYPKDAVEMLVSYLRKLLKRSFALLITVLLKGCMSSGWTQDFWTKKKPMIFRKW